MDSMDLIWLEPQFMFDGPPHRCWTDIEEKKLTADKYILDQISSNVRKWIYAMKSVIGPRKSGSMSARNSDILSMEWNLHT
uniref:Ovule protein n=1 Tax=Heterorhabditis bacteriophora TaxID=37862 RepID=A0A1I7W9S3_HETBA